MSLQLIHQYHNQVAKVIQYGGSKKEMAIRKPFQDLLEHYARQKNLELIGELDYKTHKGYTVRPDGTLKDALRQDWGFWESKDESDDLDVEIGKKFAKGYPQSNILFEDSQTAVLIQNGEIVGRVPFADAPALDAVLSQFVSYESVEVREFREAIENFARDVPELAEMLRATIHEQYDSNEKFRTAADEFLDLCRKAINASMEPADVREMIVQHVLTEDIFVKVFSEPQFHRENIIAHELGEVVGTFYRGAVRYAIDGRIGGYTNAIKSRAAQIVNHHEKQKFLKILYERFYKAYNPKAADRLGIVYTPNEIVRFMIHAADHLCYEHFGKGLGDKGVDILDPATGTGTFITELIEYLPPDQLRHKYEHELHCNEVSILPYYIANLNIEYTYKQKMGGYVPFQNILFVDTLDNMGFKTQHERQLGLFGLTDANLARIDAQNKRDISVIIGNPPYNANQLNENENNKNREYPEIDKRIKATYIKQSTAQKTKLYDMYARFLRWASDRLGRNGVIAFVSNNSFLDARTFDGFRKVVAEEFNEIWVIDMKGNARTSGERRRQEGGNVFSDEIRVGVAIYFLIRNDQREGCRIYYNAIGDYVNATDKKLYLRDNLFTALSFERLTPVKNNWLNLAENKWDDLIPVTSKDHKKTIFNLSALGVSTNRDQWVYDSSKKNLIAKIKFFVNVFNLESSRFLQINSDNDNETLDDAIKWSSSLKNKFYQGQILEYSEENIISIHYRPFARVWYYADKMLSDRLTANHIDIFGKDLKRENPIIAINLGSKTFNVLSSSILVDLHFNGDSNCLSLYRYDEHGNRSDNITDWALSQFRTHYAQSAIPLPHSAIQKLDIFHYVYAVLHNPTYRAKYELNLKREFPRIPFYADFWQWSAWGETLMALHLNYETAEPTPLLRREIDPETSHQAYKAKLRADKAQGTIELDTETTLSGIPAKAWEYKLGNRSALEWVLDRYKERTPSDPTIREQFNSYRFADYKEQVVDLLQRLVTVSVATVQIMEEMGETGEG
ncbi:MAG: N-6 DNA methylase [Chloroflexi bacterium]|nr:N-6 DNA methylase [Chloroflexota bacterium]